jgi:hypothetical protein
MNLLAHHEPSTDFNSGCADLMTMAERELSAFFKAVTQLFGLEQAKLSAEDWLHELIEIGGLPTSGPRMEIDYCKSFDPARKSNERLVPIDRTTTCLGGK